MIEVELPRDHYEGMNLAENSVVYLTPRRARFFINETETKAVNAGSDKYTTETITDVRPWTDSLFSFRTTRDRGYRFVPDCSSRGWA